jgi:predicted ATPase
LADELGVDPSPGLQAAYLSVVRGEVAAGYGTGSAGVRSESGSSPRHTNLRAQLTSFVGRDVELARIGKALEEYRLVTVVGPGGAGKTRLACEAVARWLDTVPDGVWLVELAPVTDAADVPQTVLGSLGLREAHLLDRPQKITARDAVSRLLEALADKRAVIVLDNCEHLIEASARLADTLLARCPQLRVVATSREPLGILGESLLVVPPLGQPEPDVTAAEALEFPAVRLFADRAAAVRPGFTVDDSVVRSVIEIVRRLDGLPLAIELAAARLRSLPLAEIEARLSDRFRLLTGGSRTALPRHRTLRAVVDWSWELLSEPERLLAERFAVFPSGATAEAVADVCSGAGVPAEDVADLIASLVDKSLLHPVSDGSRVRMLETIREYGIERVAERGELEALRRRHAEYFAQLMRTAEPHLVRREQLDWIAVVNAERDNILGAMRFLCDVGAADEALDLAVSLSSMAMLLGNNADAATWIADVLAAPGGTDPNLRALGEALYAISFVTTNLDRSADDVEDDITRLHELVAQLDDLETSRHPMTALLKPAVAMFGGDEQRMANWVDEGLASPDPWVAASVRMFRANIAENAGDIAQMRVDTSEALRELRLLGERWALANTLRTAALLHTYDGELDAAQEDYGEALELMQQLGSRDDETFLRVRLADLAARRGDLDAAREQVRLARISSEYSGSAMEAVFTLAIAAGIDLQVGDVAAAKGDYEQALRRYEALPALHPAMSHSGALLHAVGTALAIQDGDLDRAREVAQAAHQAAVATKDRPIAAACGTTCAVLAEALGRPMVAAQILGACSSVRGTDDPSNPPVAELTARLREILGDAAFDAAYAEGRAMDRDAALARLDPALL